MTRTTAKKELPRKRSARVNLRLWVQNYMEGVKGRWSHNSKKGSKE